MMQDRSVRTSVRAARTWLGPHLYDVPDSLRARMRAALSGENHGERSVSRALLSAALGSLDQALALGNARSAAAPLLAADALLTVACEAAAEEDDTRPFAQAACAALAQRLDGNP